MILTIDVGNSTITGGLFTPRERTHKRRMRKGKVDNLGALPASTAYRDTEHAPTGGVSKRTPFFFTIPTNEYRPGTIMRKLRREKVTQIHMCVLCSVVPRLSPRITKEIRKGFSCAVYGISTDIPLTIRHQYKKIHTLGSDRLVNLYGALRLYKTPFLVIDFGTAITFDYVNRKGIFEGGLIVPGIETSFHALINNTSLLPKDVRIVKPRSFLGRIASEGMIAGTVYGFASLTDGLIDLCKKQYGRRIQIIATGGMAPFIKTYCHHTIILDTHLTLRSLYMIATSTVKG